MTEIRRIDDRNSPEFLVPGSRRIPPMDTTLSEETKRALKAIDVNILVAFTMRDKIFVD